MTLFYLALCLATSAAVFVWIRHRYGPRWVARQVASPLAVIERSLSDAIGELAAPVSRHAIPISSTPFEATPFHENAGSAPSPRDDIDCFVNPFEPVCDRLARIPHGYIASLGGNAAAAHVRLLAAMRAWNAAAGTAESPRALLPTVMAAHLAARDLSRHVLPEELELARAAADQRILFGLVAPAVDEHLTQSIQ